LYTFRYNHYESRNTLVPLITNCLYFTHNFTQNLDRLRNIQFLDINTDTTDSENQDNLNPPEDLNMNNQNLQQLLGFVQQIANQQNIRNVVPIPTFSGGNQDPIEWIEEFERCTLINGYQINQLLDIVPGYLLNDVRDWFESIESRNATRFQSWATPTNRNFTNAFLMRYRNPGKILQWRMELQGRVQQPHETVQQYAQDIRKLLKRSDAEGVFSESERIFQFTKGLRREIAAQVTSQLTFQQNPRFDQVVDAAGQIEAHGRMYPETLVGFYSQQPPSTNQYLTNNFAAQTQAPLNNQITNDTLATLLQALSNLNLNQPQNLPQNNSNNNNGNINNNNRGPQRNRPPRNPAVCYRCQQMGHIARNCPNAPVSNNNQQAPIQQPAVQAFAQQIPVQNIQPMQQPVYQQPQVPIQVQPQVQPQAQPQMQQPVQQQSNQINQNNTFLSIDEMQVQQPQAQVYGNQSLNYQMHL
jgi:hypothetical protein